jgi:hypothetical protein
MSLKLFKALLVAELALWLRKREPLEGKERSDHVFAHALGLLSGGSFDLAVDGEAGVAPPHDLLPKEKSEELPGKHLGQEDIRESRDVMEVAIPIFTSLCY